MTVLRDKSIANLLQSNPPLATNIDDQDIGWKTSQIQPASLDLTIGAIFVPGNSPDSLGGINNHLEETNLPRGGIAVVRTKEELCLPDNLAAIGFPPSSVSLKGLLMTNPGHVDPGYKGTMSFTVINMAKEDYRLAVGDPIVTLLFMTLDAASSTPWANLRERVARPAGGINQKLLEVLSSDFMDIEKRSEKKAQEVVDKAQWKIPLISAVAAALITLLGTFIASFMQPWADDIEQVSSKLSDTNLSVARVEARLGALGADIDLQTLEDRLVTIEERIQDLPQQR